MAFDMVDGGPENESLMWAMHVVFAEFQGAKYDWRTQTWDKT